MSEVSIIITTHDRPKLLTRAVESALAASFRRRVEVVVVDDASGEETAHLCRSLQGIKYVRLERNHGVAGARNRGILESSGKYISFLDDDDARLEGSLDNQLDALEASPHAGFIYGQAILGLEDGSPTEEFYPAHCPEGDVFPELLSQNFVPCGTAVFRRSCLERVGMLDPAIPCIDDWDLWLRIAEHYPALSKEEPVMIWRKSTPLSKQGTSNAAGMVELCTSRFYEHWLMLPRAQEFSARVRREISRKFSNNMANHLLWEAVRSLAYGKALRSQKNILTAIRLCPAGTARALLRPENFRFLLRQAPKEREALRNSAIQSREREIRSSS
jgi:glycosyltransferase involved in cell wall biosynthesis